MTLSVADLWFGVDPIDRGLLRLREAHVDPFLAGNIWLARGRDRSLLIDSGTGIMPLRATAEAIAGTAVVAVALNCFYDHAGGLYEFDERLGHGADAAALAQPTDETSVASQYVSDAMLRALPSSGYSTAGYAMKPAPLTRVLDHGDIIDLGDRRFEVIHTPGMTPGSLSLWEPESGRLFTSDLLYIGPDGGGPRPRDPAAYGASLARIEALSVRAVHPGHFDSFDGARMRAAVMGAQGPSSPAIASGNGSIEEARPVPGADSP